MYTNIVVIRLHVKDDNVDGIKQLCNHPKCKSTHKLKALFNNVFTLKKSELHVPTCNQCLS